MVKKTPKIEGNENEIREQLVHIAFSASEKEKIKNLAKESNTTISEFIRQSIFDKILRIENPTAFNVDNEERLREIENNQKKTLELQQLLLERIKIVNGINETMKALKPLVNKSEMKEICDTIVSMLRIHKSMKIEKLELLTSFKRKDIYDCISINPKLAINENEEVYINE
jgi:hypothetical protein